MAKMTEPIKYTPSWSPAPPAVPCPGRLEDALHDAWDLLGVRARHRQRVLGQKRPREEWGSFALVLRKALEQLGLGHLPAARQLEIWGPDPDRASGQQGLAAARAG